MKTQKTLADLLTNAQVEPWKYGFYALVRRLSAHHPQSPAIGHAKRPQQEVVKLGQTSSLVFSPREIAQIEQKNHQTQIRLFGLGMLGPNGPLPTHYTETVREARDTRQDHTIANFLDMFHHRFMTHFYRAWYQSQSATTLDRKENEIFTRYVAWLGGDEVEEAAQTKLPTHTRWAFLAQRIRQARNPDGMTSALSFFFQVPVHLTEYQLNWIDLPLADQTRLSAPQESSILGVGAVLGQKIPDRQSRFRLVIGPLSLEQYLLLTPQGVNGLCDLPILRDAVRSFIGLEYDWEVELLIQAEEAPATQLGSSHQLGWSTWLGNAPASKTSITGMIFTPETYRL
jgi:type VI secretion system protein ImpH